MSDRRDTGQVPGQDPIDVTEDYPESDLSFRRVHSVRADVEMELEVECSTPANYHVQADVDSEFKAREGRRHYYIQADVESDFTTDEEAPDVVI